MEQPNMLTAPRKQIIHIQAKEPDATQPTETPDFYIQLYPKNGTTLCNVKITVEYDKQLTL
jgi:hypothetical protein